MIAVRGLGLATLAAGPAMAVSAQVSAAEAPPAVQAPAGDEVVAAVESARRSVRSTAEWLARGVDSWFGDQPFSAGGKVSEGRLSLGLLTRQRESPDVDVRFNARFKLPNAEKISYLFIGRDDQREVVADKPEAVSRAQRLLRENTADRTFFAGLGLLLHDRVDFRLGLRGGLKPYAQLRYRQRWQLDAADLVDFRQTLFWAVDEHVGATTAVSWERGLSSTLALRWLTVATITQQSKKLDWSSGLGAYQSFGEQRLLSLQLLVSGAQVPGVPVSDYGLQAQWAQPVYQDWLLGEVLLGRFWPRQDAQTERRGAWALGGRVTMKF